MQQLSTAAQTLKPERRHLNADLIAGLTFAIVNVPQAMAHAVLATVNPVLGIYTLMVAVPIGALFTGSVFMNVSSTGALSVAAGSALAAVPVDQRAQALVMHGAAGGVIQLLAGLFKLGFVVRFVSNSVMTGFLNGVAVLIILGQLGDLTGYRAPSATAWRSALDLLLHLPQIDVPTTIIGLLTLALIVLLLAHRCAVRLHHGHRRLDAAVGPALAAGLGRRAELAGGADGGRRGHHSPHPAWLALPRPAGCLACCCRPSPWRSSA
jgi:MFS superfamily sulfate permease-like transporter